MAESVTDVSVVAFYDVLEAFVERHRDQLASGDMPLVLDPIAMNALVTIPSHSHLSEIISRLTHVDIIPLRSFAAMEIATQHFVSIEHLGIQFIPIHCIQDWQLLCKRLVALKLTKCEIDLKNWGSSLQWPRLRCFSCKYSALTSISESWILSCPNLVDLNLSHNLLATIPSLQTCTQLDNVDLSFNRISELAQANTFLGNINTLRLSNNRITHCSGLHRLYALQSLDMSNNCISDIQQVAKLASLPLLKDLWLSGNPIALLPNYRITILGIFSSRQPFCLDGTPIQPSEALQVKQLFGTTHSQDAYSTHRVPYSKSEQLDALTPRLEDPRNTNIRASVSPRHLEVSSKMSSGKPKVKRKTKHEKRRSNRIASIHSDGDEALLDNVPTIDFTDDAFQKTVEQVKEEGGNAWLLILNEMQSDDMPAPVVSKSPVDNVHSDPTHSTAVPFISTLIDEDTIDDQEIEDALLSSEFIASVFNDTFHSAIICFSLGHLAELNTKTGDVVCEYSWQQLTSFVSLENTLDVLLEFDLSILYIIRLETNESLTDFILDLERCSSLACHKKFSVWLNQTRQEMHPMVTKYMTHTDTPFDLTIAYQDHLDALVKADRQNEEEDLMQPVAFQALNASRMTHRVSSVHPSDISSVHEDGLLSFVTDESHFVEEENPTHVQQPPLSLSAYLASETTGNISPIRDASMIAFEPSSPVVTLALNTEVISEAATADMDDYVDDHDRHVFEHFGKFAMTQPTTNVYNATILMSGHAYQMVVALSSDLKLYSDPDAEQQSIVSPLSSIPNHTIYSFPFSHITSMTVGLWYSYIVIAADSDDIVIFPSSKQTCQTLFRHLYTHFDKKQCHVQLHDKSIESELIEATIQSPMALDAWVPHLQVAFFCWLSQFRQASLTVPEFTHSFALAIISDHLSIFRMNWTTQKFDFVTACHVDGVLSCLATSSRALTYEVVPGNLLQDEDVDQVSWHVVFASESTCTFVEQYVTSCASQEEL